MRATPNILIVDDTESARQTVEAQLASCDYALRFAVNAAQARRAVAEQIPDLVLLDVMMAGTDGIELCREWRQNPELGLMSIVVVSALDSREDTIRGLKAGANEFLTKPTHGAELRTRLANLLDAKRLRELTLDQHQAALGEIDRLRDQLLRVERLATFATFAAGVGHELNNISQVLTSGTWVLLEQLDAGVPVDREVAESLAAASAHVAEHGKTIMRMATPATTKALRAIDVFAVAKSVVQMLKVAGRTKGVALQVHGRSGTGRVCWHEVHLEQVLINLCANAADALQEVAGAKRIDIRVRCDAAAKWVSIIVEDNGAGMPPAVLERAFEPFYTTKPPGEGTGLGLLVIKNLVESRGGSISIETTVGRGTIVNLKLPAAPLQGTGSGER